MRDELNEPLGRRPTPPPLARRLAPLAAWTGRLALVGLAGGAAAFYWRGGLAPPKAQVAVIPFEAVKTAAPTAPTAPVSTNPSVFPPAADAGGVSIVRNGAAGAAGGHGPEIIDVPQALGEQPPPAAERRLLESSRFGPLPRIAADGTRPSDVYARPFAETAMTRGAPRIALFVGGLGLDAQTTAAAISRLPGGVSLGLAPYGGDLAEVAGRARAAGHEIWLQAPMQGVEGPDPGPHTLKSGASEAENLDSLHWLMGRFTGYVGVANYLGAKFTADAGAATPVLAEIARRGLLFLDDGSSALSKTAELAAGLDLKAGRADVNADATDAALEAAEDIARRRGAAIVVASVLPGTLDRVARWAAALEGKGFALAPVSALVTEKPARAAGANP